MLELADWITPLDDFILDLLHQAGRASPPVDTVDLVRRFRWPMAWDKLQRQRGRMIRIAGRPTVLVRPEDRWERLQWAVAHEIGEAQLATFCQRLGATPDDFTPRQRERWANQFARRLLLPTAWFRDALEDTHGDLLALKERFRTASHELIAWRWLDFPRPAWVVSIFDQGRLTRRGCNFAVHAPPLLPEEGDCARAARLFGTPQTLRNITAWPIHEEGWKREIVRTRWPSTSSDET